MITKKNYIQEKVFKTLSLIPKGYVTTYKLIAQKTGVNNPRIIGQIIHRNTNPEKFPCHRVVKSDGNLASGYAFGGKIQQAKKLRKEGVTFIEGKVELKKHLYSPPIS